MDIFVSILITPLLTPNPYLGLRDLVSLYKKPAEVYWSSPTGHFF